MLGSSEQKYVKYVIKLTINLIGLRSVLKIYKYLYLITPLYRTNIFNSTNRQLKIFSKIFKSLFAIFHTEIITMS